MRFFQYYLNGNQLVSRMRISKSWKANVSVTCGVTILCIQPIHKDAAYFIFLCKGWNMKASSNVFDTHSVLQCITTRYFVIVAGISVQILASTTECIIRLASEHSNHTKSIVDDLTAYFGQKIFTEFIHRLGGWVSFICRCIENRKFTVDLQVLYFKLKSHLYRT